VKVLVGTAVWIAAIVLLRWALRRAYERWERRHLDGDAASVARRRTTFSFLQRVAVAIVGLVGIWNILSLYSQTEVVARAVLASSAVLAVFAGLALNTPLGNLGSGVLVAFTQPLRLGDRVTIGEQTGFVEQINLIYTSLVTDDDKRIFIPNTQLTTTPIVNRTIRDPRRVVAATLPVRLDASIGAARDALLAAAAPVTSVTDTMLTLSGSAALDANVPVLMGELRERGLAALADAGLLPAR
jgi:small conductance mechanosensitive channel